MVHVAAAIHRAGAAVLMIDYRGLGKSSRRALTEATMYEDAEAAWHELRWHQPDPALRLVYGHSLGGVIALELAARYPDVSGVVVEAAPTSIAALLRESWVARVYPVDAMLAGRFDAAAKVRRIGAPLLVIHGKRDRSCRRRWASSSISARRGASGCCSSTAPRTATPRSSARPSTRGRSSACCRPAGSRRSPVWRWPRRWRLDSRLSFGGTSIRSPVDRSPPWRWPRPMRRDFRSGANARSIRRRSTPARARQARSAQ